MTFAHHLDLGSNQTPIKLAKCVVLKIFGITTHLGRTKNNNNASVPHVPYASVSF